MLQELSVCTVERKTAHTNPVLVSKRASEQADLCQHKGCDQVYVNCEVGR